MDRLLVGFAIAVVLVAAAIGLAAADALPAMSGGPSTGEALRPTTVGAVLMAVLALLVWAHDRPRREG